MELIRNLNTATYIVFPIKKSDGSLLSGAAGLDSQVDGWSDSSAPNGFTDCTNEATEIGSTGFYYLSMTASELNNDYVIVVIKSSTTGAIPQVVLINTVCYDTITSDLQQIPQEIQDVSDAAWSGPADILTELQEIVNDLHDTDLPAVKTATAAIKAKTDNLPASPANEATLTTLHGHIDDILGDTAEIQAELADGGRTDLLIDAIKTVVDANGVKLVAVQGETDMLPAVWFSP